MRRSRFSSCRALHLSLNVSSSILRTLFSCCKEARRFVSSSRRNCEMTMLGFPEFEAEDDIGVAELLPAPSVSLSLALSAMVVRQCGEGKTTAAAAAFEERTQQNGRPCDLAHACRHSATARMSPVPPGAPLTNETGACNTVHLNYSIQNWIAKEQSGQLSQDLKADFVPYHYLSCPPVFYSDLVTKFTCSIFLCITLSDK